MVQHIKQGQHTRENKAQSGTLPLTYFFSHGKALWVSNRSEFLFFQLVNSVLVISQVDLGSNKNDWGAGAVMPHLRIPLGGNKEMAHSDVT